MTATINFELEGLFNSFKIPSTGSYQLSYLAPPKTVLIGMLTNIMGLKETHYYDLLKKIAVAIVPLSVSSRFADLWSFKKWKGKNYGKDILNREKLFLPKYSVYVKTDETNDDAEALLEQIENALKQPQRVPSLGMDDELVLIKKVERKILKPLESSNIVHSIATYENGEFTQILDDVPRKVTIIPARVVTVPVDYDRSKIPRRISKTLQIVEFFGGKLEFKHPKTQIFVDSSADKEIRVEFL